MTQHPPVDPVEVIIYDALVEAGIPFTNNARLTDGLDFMIEVDPPIYIECKRFHSPRITEQMSRKTNVIAVQGLEAANWLAKRLRDYR